MKVVDDILGHIDANSIVALVSLDISHGQPHNSANEARRGLRHNWPGFAMDKFILILEEFLRASWAIVVVCFFVPGGHLSGLMY